MKIEEDIILLKDFTEGNFKRDKLENYKGSYKMGYFYYKDIQQALEHILSDYKRVLKENEELKKFHIQDNKHLDFIMENSISVQKVKDKIEEYKKMLLSCNSFSDVDRIKAINERILELQELLEGGKEKTADELFDDLGLWLERETPFDFEVKNDDDKVIKFNKERREIACFNYYDGFEYLTLQELQAINKKCQELGWLKED